MTRQRPPPSSPAPGYVVAEPLCGTYDAPVASGSRGQGQAVGCEAVALRHAPFGFFLPSPGLDESQSRPLSNSPVLIYWHHALKGKRA